MQVARPDGGHPSLHARTFEQPRRRDSAPGTAPAFTERPWDLGPGGVESSGVARIPETSLQPHSDHLGYLVERSVPGLLGLVLLWVMIRRFARPVGIARLLIPGLLVAGIIDDLGREQTLRRPRSRAGSAPA